MSYTVLAYSYRASFHDTYKCLWHAHYRYRLQLPYKRHRTYLTNHMGPISRHITPLVINSLRVGTHTRTHAHTYRHSRTEVILRNQVCTGLWLAHTWFNNYVIWHELQLFWPYCLVTMTTAYAYAAGHTVYLVYLAVILIWQFSKSHKDHQINCAPLSIHLYCKQPFWNPANSVIWANRQIFDSPIILLIRYYSFHPQLCILNWKDIQCLNPVTCSWIKYWCLV